MNLTYVHERGIRKIVVTSHHHEITLDPRLVSPDAAVIIRGKHRVILPGGLDAGPIRALDCDVVAQDGVQLLSLDASSLKAEAGLYPVCGINIATDAEITGILTGERHFRYRVGGNLKAQGIDIDGHVEVRGNVDADWIVARSLKRGGMLNCSRVSLEDPETAFEDASAAT